MQAYRMYDNWQSTQAEAEGDSMRSAWPQDSCCIAPGRNINNAWLYLCI